MAKNKQTNKSFEEAPVNTIVFKFKYNRCKGDFSLYFTLSQRLVGNNGSVECHCCYYYIARQKKKYLVPSIRRDIATRRRNGKFSNVYSGRPYAATPIDEAARAQRGAKSCHGVITGTAPRRFYSVLKYDDNNN